MGAQVHPASLLALQAPQINLASSIGQGLGIGDYLRQRSLEDEFRQQVSQAIDPATGEISNPALMSALARYNPKLAVSAMDEIRKQGQFQQGMGLLQQALQNGGGGTLGGGAGPSGSVTQTGPSPLTNALVMAGGFTGMPAVTQLGVMRNAWEVENAKRQQDLVDVYNPATQTMVKMPRGMIEGAPTGVPISTSPMAPPTALPAPSAVPPSAAMGAGKADVGAFQDKPFFSDAYAIAKNYGIKPDVFLSLIQQESGFNPAARSDAGAMGLTQLMPATARELGVSDPFHPIQNLAGGAKYLRQLLDRYNGDYTKALAAYNAGPGAVDKYGGIPPYAETKNYVPAVLAGSGPIGLQPPTPPTAYPPGVIPTGPSIPERTAQEVELAQRKSAIEEARQNRLRALEQQQLQQNEQFRAGLQTGQQIASEQRAIPNKLLVSGEEAWVDQVYKPAIGEYKNNVDSLNKLNTMEGLLKQGKTGPGEPFYTKARNFLASLGLPQSMVDSTKEQELVAVSNSLVWEELAKQKGPQTDQDFSRMQAIYPSLEKYHETNQFLIDSSKAILTRRQQQIEFYRRNYQKYAASGNPSMLEDAWNQTPQANQSIWDMPMMRQWAKKYEVIAPTPTLTPDDEARIQARMKELQNAPQ